MLLLSSCGVIDNATPTVAPTGYENGQVARNVALAMAGDDDILVPHRHLHGIAILERARQQTIGERVFNLVLNDAAERAHVLRSEWQAGCRARVF